ncbi:MAG: hypothetical protein ACC645_09045, partial [Pirellulales bacterium]
SDWYAFSLDDGQSVTLVFRTRPLNEARLELYNDHENLLARGVPAENVSQIINDFMDTTSDGLPDTYFARVMGSRRKYTLLLGKDADFDAPSTSDSQQDFQAFPASGIVLGALTADGAGADADRYRLNVNAGDTLTVTTLLPAAQPGQFVNALDVAVELYNPEDELVATGAGGSLTHTAQATGSYTVRVLAEGGTAGEYVLSASGATAAMSPFQVTTTDPADGAALSAPPAELRVSLSDQVRVPSLEASDLMVDGRPATAVAVVDGDTLVFTLPTLVEGANHVAIAEGAIEDVEGQPIEALVGQWMVDTTPPRVIDMSIQEDATVPAGVPLTVSVRFDEPLNTPMLDSTALRLTTQFGGEYPPTDFGYDPITSTMTVEFPPLAEDRYTLTLLSGDGQFEDLVGNDLDGESSAWPIPPNRSGNGVWGGDFVVHFQTEVTTAPFPPPLEMIWPVGSLVYAAETAAVIGE